MAKKFGLMGRAVWKALGLSRGVRSASRSMAQGSRSGIGASPSIASDLHGAVRDFSNISRLFRNYALGGSRAYLLETVRSAIDRSPHMRSFFRLAKQGVLNGMTIHPLFSDVEDKKLRALLQKLWADFEEQCLVAGRPDMLNLQEGLIQSLLTDGMVIFLKRHSSELEHGFGLIPLGREYLVEGYTNRQDRIFAGMKFSELGRLTHYYLVKDFDEYYRHFDPLYRLTTQTAAGSVGAVAVPADQLVVVMTPDRHDELMSLLPPAIAGAESAEKIRVLDTATLTALSLAARKNIVITKTMDSSVTRPKEEEEELASDLENAEIPDGNVVELPAGWDAKALEVAWPAIKDIEARKEILRTLSGLLGVDYSSFANDAAESNFANTRAHSLLTREMWRRLHRTVARQFVRPVLHEWLATVRFRGLLGNISDAEFSAAMQSQFYMRSWPWIDPLKDAAAQARLLECGATTPQRILAQQGMTMDEAISDFRDFGRALVAANVNGEIDAVMNFLPVMRGSARNNLEDNALLGGQGEGGGAGDGTGTGSE